MEHGEYAIQELKVRFMQNQSYRDADDNFVKLPSALKEETIRIVAPTSCFYEKHLGLQLINIELEEMFRFCEPLPDGKKYLILSQVEHKLDKIIQYSSKYRSQL